MVPMMPNRMMTVPVLLVGLIFLTGPTTVIKVRPFIIVTAPNKNNAAIKRRSYPYRHASPKPSFRNHHGPVSSILSGNDSTEAGENEPPSTSSSSSLSPENNQTEASPLASSTLSDNNRTETGETASSSSSPPSSPKQNQIKAPPTKTLKEVFSMGGKDGFVYDVNKVKRNFIQEAVRKNKQEFLELLSTPAIYSKYYYQPDGDYDEYDDDDASQRKNAMSTEDRNDYKTQVELQELIEEKLASLVQVNPVSTTTDSNLLDGQWEFAYATNRYPSEYSTTGILNDDPQIIPWRFREGFFRSSVKHVNLENLADDQDAYVQDSTNFLGGFLTLDTLYSVTKLSRTSLFLQKDLSKITLFKSTLQLRRSRKGTAQEEEMSVLYLDSDLCIMTMTASSKITDGINTKSRGALLVYTKSETWAGSIQRAQRKVRFLLALQSPFKLRKRIRSRFRKRNQPPKEQTKTTARQSMLVERETTTSTYRALKIGEVDENGFSEEEDSWEDPFGELEDIERLARMKNMSLGEIQDAGSQKKIESDQRREELYKIKKRFKKPTR